MATQLQDIVYYRDRMLAERAAARDIANPIVAAVHRQLACRYQQRLTEMEELLSEREEQASVSRSVG